MDEAYIGSIVLFAGNYAPRNWAFCSGQLVAISENPSLFSILGTVYGGDGVNTFGLPDLRGRVPIHPGTGIGLTTRLLGESSGFERVNISEAQMPSHTHGIASVLHASEEANTEDPSGNFIAGASTPSFSGSNDVTLNENAVTNDCQVSGQNQAHFNMQPYLGLNYIICTIGLYPPRP